MALEVKVGDKFAVRKDYSQGYTGRILTVAKIYKTGRFVMEGDIAPLTQWHVFSDCIMTCGGGYRRSSADPLTYDVSMKIDVQKRVDAAKRILSDHAEQLLKLARSGDNESILAEAALIQGDPL